MLTKTLSLMPIPYSAQLILDLIILTKSSRQYRLSVLVMNSGLCCKLVLCY